MAHDPAAVVDQVSCHWTAGDCRNQAKECLPLMPLLFARLDMLR
jgi:hypothetical protein